uniref:WD repeat-containing protein 7 n=1 Tax=Phallusia mammillata TaxID=59560 RepID=A0A6F9DX68_9ASCI|nr:WD repeat-containing protein 7 [Phallusia mammillata]
MTNSLVVPLVLWGNKPPTHRVCSILVTPDLQHIVTGCRDGQLCIWKYNDKGIIPKSMLFGHTSSVVSITSVPNGTGGSWKKQHIASASESGEICLWELVDGRCLEQSKLPGSPISIIGYNFVLNNEPQQCLMCFGQFAEILILSASTLTVLLSLASRIFPDWLGCACIVPCIRSAEPCNIIGLTVAGMLKVWRIHKSCSQQILFEEESKQLTQFNAQSIKVHDNNNKLLLLVCTNQWQVCDIGDYSALCSVQAKSGHPWVDGDFLTSDNVAVWTRSGEVFIYRLPFSAASQEVYRSRLKDANVFHAEVLHSISLLKMEKFLLPPAIRIHQSSFDGKLYLAAGNCGGTIAMTELDSTTFLSGQVHEASLVSLWNQLDHKPVGIMDHLSHNSKEPMNITATLFIVQYCYLCCGREDGSIVIVPAAQACKVHLLQDDGSSRRIAPAHRTLRGHRDRVTCLLYPHQEAPNRYSAECMVSGGADFSVVVWDISSGTVMHSFHVHGGDISQLIIPPDGCNQRVKQAICSVGSDNSVALLSLRDRKCVLLASRHPSPIVGIRWRPEDDFLIISCADSTVFVWQMETGHLDRFESGAVAMDILAACDEIEQERSNHMMQNHVNLSHALKSRSLMAFKMVAQQGLRSLIDGLNEEKVIDGNIESQGSNKTYQAMIVSSLKASPIHDTDSHVVFINTEALIARLLVEHSATTKKMLASSRGNSNTGPANTGRRVLNSFLQQVKSQFLDEGSDTSSQPELRVTTTKKGKKSATLLDIDSAKDIAHVIVSCIHGWGLDDKLDRLCRETLGLTMPKAPVCFGLLSQDGHMALQFPRAPIKQDCEPKNCATHWQISSCLTTQLLMSIISIANTVMELPDACFKKNLKKVKHVHNENTDSTSEDQYQYEHSDLVDQSQVKQGWSLLATLHCVLLPEKMEGQKYKPPKLELLARRWQDRCLELREAAQALMLAELRQMGHEGRRRVVETWSHHVPDYINHPAVSAESFDSPASHIAADDVGDRSSIASDELAAAPLVSLSNTKLSYEVRRRHATAIVILGVIGAEFGQELEPRRSQRSNMDVPDGFGLADYSLARHTCKALVYLLLQSPSPKLPAHIPIRRAAIDLLGRGFTVWEPYMEVTAVLLGLLELCETYTQHIASIQSGLPLSSEADSCRTAHHSLCLIATARPLTFITTIAREVARHNAAAANPQHQALLATSILVRAKPEILRIVDLLADKMMTDVNNVLVEVVDIVLFCIDVSVLRASYGLLEAVPALAKFHTVSYDNKSRRVAVAAGNGAIVLYDTRTCKHQVVQRPSTRITALCFSPDGKYLCVYTASDNQLNFWITATSLFGMLQSQVKCVKTINPLKTPQHGRGQHNGGMLHSKLNVAKLVWVNNRVVVLLTGEGQEYRFHI